MKRIIYSFPVAMTAILFIVPILSKQQHLLNYDLPSLAHIMQIEFLVLGGGLLTAMFGVIQPSTLTKHLLRLVIISMLLSPFAMGAYSINKFSGFLSYCFLVYATYGNGLFVYQAGLMGYLGILRWIISLFIFFSLLVYFDLGNGNVENWVYKKSIIPFGASFFSLLTLLELTFYFYLQSHIEKQILDQEKADEIYYKRVNFYKYFKQ